MPSVIPVPRARRGNAAKRYLLRNMPALDPAQPQYRTRSAVPRGGTRPRHGPQWSGARLRDPTTQPQLWDIPWNRAVLYKHKAFIMNSLQDFHGGGNGIPMFRSGDGCGRRSTGQRTCTVRWLPRARLGTLSLVSGLEWLRSQPGHRHRRWPAAREAPLKSTSNSEKGSLVARGEV